MLTNTGTIDSTTAPRRLRVASSTQKVVIVNGSSQVLELLETTLDAGHYDVVFVESSAHAYSQIKRVQPNLVILCVRLTTWRDSMSCRCSNWTATRGTFRS
jgi:CheY-like chemotaxis protein